MDSLEMTGQAFTGMTAQVIEFSESIVDMAGDLDTFRDAAENYYDKFFTDVEKQARLQDQLSATMSDMGESLPLARDGYRAVVESLDLTTKAGQVAPHAHSIAVDRETHRVYLPIENVDKHPVLRVMEPAH